MKLMYRPFGLVLGALGGMVGGAVFKRVWAAMSGRDEAPSATAYYQATGVWPGDD